MKRIFLVFLFIILNINVSQASELYNTDNLTVFSEKSKFGLKNKSGEIIVEAKYKKLIRLGNSSWIVLAKNNKFGLIDCNGEILIEPKFKNVERVFTKFVKLGNSKDFGLYDEYGKVIIPPEFSSIEPLFGKKFLTIKNFKYGIYKDNGELLLDNKFDFIYMPNPETMKLQYEGEWYQITNIKRGEELDFSALISEENKNTSTISDVIKNSGIGAGYTVVTATDYVLKVLSSISPAYEDTIDDLMLSQGVDTVFILVKLSWIPRFPITYAKNYYKNLVTPNNSPLSEIRQSIKGQLSD
jgi:hypothetical protein